MAETPWYRRNTSWSVIAAVVGSLVAAVAGFVSSLDSLSSVRVRGVEITLEQQRAIKVMAAQVAALEGELKAIRDSLKGLSQAPDSSKASIQLDHLRKTVTDLETRHGKLEQAILANPTKALEIPPLQRDLDSLRTAQQENVLALRQSVDRVYDLNKWLLGAMAVSIVTLALSNLLKGREPSEKK